MSEYSFVYSKEKVEYENQKHKIYGIKIKNDEPTANVIRIADAKGLVAKYGNDSELGEPVNDFDNLYPWKNEFTKDLYGNEFRKIRLFFVKFIYGKKWTKIYISMTKHDSDWFALPCFTDYSKTVIDEDGHEQFALLPYVEIGRYLASYSEDGAERLESKPDRYVRAHISRTQSRAAAQKNNSTDLNTSGYQIEDMSTLFALQAMFMIEYATINGQGTSEHPGMQGSINLTNSTERPVLDEAATNRIVVKKSSNTDKLATEGATILLTTNSDPSVYGALKFPAREIVSVLECDETGKLTVGGNHYAIYFEGEPVDVAKTDYAINASYKTGFSRLIDGSSGHIGLNDGKTPMMYRGIESFWGDIWRWIDGINFNNSDIWVCNDASKYTDNKFVGPDYEKLSFKRPPEDGYIKTMGYDSNYPHVFYPEEKGATSSTYFADMTYSRSEGQHALRAGGSWMYGASAGPFALNSINQAAWGNNSSGCRLVRKAFSA